MRYFNFQNCFKKELNDSCLQNFTLGRFHFYSNLVEGMSVKIWGDRRIQKSVEQGEGKI